MVGWEAGQAGGLELLEDRKTKDPNLSRQPLSPASLLLQLTLTDTYLLSGWLGTAT